MRSIAKHIKLLALICFSFVVTTNLSAQTEAKTSIQIDSLLIHSGNLTLSHAGYTQFGYTMVSGDFNGDGIDDIAIGEPGNEGGYQEKGMVSIYFGNQSGLSDTLTKATIRYNDPDPNVNPEADYNNLGEVISSADLNGDEIDDLILSILDDDIVFVLFGRTDWNLELPYTLNDLTVNSGRKIMDIENSNQTNRDFGYALAAGDFDGNGSTDLFIAQETSSGSSSYLIYGETLANNFAISTDTLSASSAVTFNYGAYNAIMADFNNDGADDLAMARNQVYLIFGTDSKPPSFDLDQSNLAAFIRITGGSKNTIGINNIKSGDINRDGIADLIVDDFNYETFTTEFNGAVYVLYGTTNGLASNVYGPSLTGSEGFSIIGIPQTNLELTDVFDLDNDGYSDLILHDYFGNMYSAMGSVAADSTWGQIQLTEAGLYGGFNIDLNRDVTPARNIVRGSAHADLNGDEKIDLVFAMNGGSPREISDVFFLTDLDSLVSYHVDEEPEYSFSGGDGTPENPYQILTAAQLDSVRYYLDAHFIQIADIDMNVAPFDTGQGFIPIGGIRADDKGFVVIGTTHFENDVRRPVNKTIVTDAKNTPFSGTFDGNGFEIQNLMMNRYTYSSHIGLFSIIADTVQNVTLTNPSILATHPSGVISYGDPAGTLAGLIDTTGVIINSHIVDAHVKVSSANAGLLAGYSLGTIERSSTHGLIENAHVSGGILGIMETGSLTESYSSAQIDNSMTSGGLIGALNSSPNTPTPIVRFNYSSTIFTVSSPMFFFKPGFGGLIGRINGGIITDNYSFVTNSVQNRRSIPTGGLFGSINAEENSIFSIGLNYWSTDLFGEVDSKNASTDSLSGEVKNEGGLLAWQMKQTEFWAGWEFGTIWEIDEGSSFPYLLNNPPINLPGSEIQTSNELVSETPFQTTLHQNYPNPFNPSTIISFELPKQSSVTLSVLDIMGRKIASLLVDKPLAAGAHSVTFNASDKASGTYFYVLETDNMYVTRKMVLIK